MTLGHAQPITGSGGSSKKQKLLLKQQKGISSGLAQMSKLLQMSGDDSTNLLRKHGCATTKNADSQRPSSFLDCFSSLKRNVDTMTTGAAWMVSMMTSM